MRALRRTLRVGLPLAIGAAALASCALAGFTVLDEVAPVKTPAFVYVAADDKYAPSGTAYAAACKEKKIPCDFHKPEHGGHGFGLKAVLPPEVKDWPDKLRAFLDGLK